MRYLLIFLLSCTSAHAFTKNAGTKEYWTDASFGDVTNAFQNLKDTVTEDGWAIILGESGKETNWSNGHTFSGHVYDWTIKGSNDVDTVIQLDNGGVTFTGAGNANSTTADIVTVQDIYFKAVASGTDISPLVTMSGNDQAHNYILVSCQFDNQSGDTVDGHLDCNAWGLVYSNNFWGGSERKIWCRDHSSNQWSKDATWGSVSNVVIENNFVDNDSSGPVTMTQWLDGDKGMRVIARHNQLTNANCEAHGCTSDVTKPDGTGEGHHAEYYANDHYMDGAGGDSADWLWFSVRGGSAWVYSNTCAVADMSSWGDHNYGLLIWPEQGNLDSGCDDPQMPGYVISNAVSTLSPIYIWDNTESLAGPNFAAVGERESQQNCSGLEYGSICTVTLNTHFYTETTAPTFVQLEYPHPLRSAAAPSNLRVISAGKITTTGKIGLDQ